MIIELVILTSIESFGDCEWFFKSNSLCFVQFFFLLFTLKEESRCIIIYIYNTYIILLFPTHKMGMKILELEPTNYCKWSWVHYPLPMTQIQWHCWVSNLPKLSSKGSRLESQSECCFPDFNKDAKAIDSPNVDHNSWYAKSCTHLISKWPYQPKLHSFPPTSKDNPFQFYWSSVHHQVTSITCATSPPLSPTPTFPFKIHTNIIKVIAHFLLLKLFPVMCIPTSPPSSSFAFSSSTW